MDLDLMIYRWKTLSKCKEGHAGKRLGLKSQGCGEEGESLSF